MQCLLLLEVLGGSHKHAVDGAVKKLTKLWKEVTGGSRGWWALLLLCHPRCSSSSSSSALHSSSSEPQPGGTVLISHSQPRTQPELRRHAGAAGAVLHEPQGDGRGQPAQGKWTPWKGGGGIGFVLLAPAAGLVWSLAFSLRTLAFLHEL